MRSLIPTVLCALAACSTDPRRGTQFGEEDQLECREVSSTPVGAGPIALEEGDLPIDALLERLDGEHVATTTWTDGTETEVTATIALDAASLERVTYEAWDSNTDTPVVAPGAACHPRVVGQATWSVTTADGRLDEAGSEEVVSDNWGSWLDALVEAPVGTVDPEALADTDVPVRASGVRIALSVYADTFSGTIDPIPASDPWEDVRALTAWPRDDGTEEE